MSREKLLQEISELILQVEQPHPVRVGIDGVDAAGKTFLANELVLPLKRSGRNIIRASIDGFHNPKEIRSRRGIYSAEGYYYDSFDYDLIVKYLLKPLGSQGNRKYRPVAFDFKTDKEVLVEKMKAEDTDILIFEGVFLFRPELYGYWDFKVFVDVEFETNVARALRRDTYLFGEKEEILKRYQERYIPGQQIYLESVKPKLRADIVIDNNKIEEPKIVMQRV